jgi:hypothetical protein
LGELLLAAHFERRLRGQEAQVKVAVAGREELLEIGRMAELEHDALVWPVRGDLQHLWSDIGLIVDRFGLPAAPGQDRDAAGVGLKVAIVDDGLLLGADEASELGMPHPDQQTQCDESDKQHGDTRHHRTSSVRLSRVTTKAQRKAERHIIRRWTRLRRASADEHGFIRPPEAGKPAAERRTAGQETRSCPTGHRQRITAGPGLANASPPQVDNLRH